MRQINIKEQCWSALDNNDDEKENYHIADVSEKIEEIITGCPTGWKCGAECTNRCIK